MPFVSAVIPCRDEEFFLPQCLESLLLQDFPKENLEILFVDGMSKDRTKELIKEYSQKYPFVRLLENPNKTTPFGMNMGIKNSRGDIIIIMGAHSVYAPDYISKCVRYLLESRADNVGGQNIIVSKNGDIFNKAVAKALASPFGAGDAHYIIGSKKSREVDTVFGGCYRKEVFTKLGLFNERLTRSEDMELNLRLKRAGGKIMFFPDIKSYYYPRKSHLKGFFWHNFQNGIWVVYPLKIVKTPLRLRHYIPFIFVFSLIVSGFLGIFSKFSLSIFWLLIVFYLLANLYFSFKISFKEKSPQFLFLLPLIFGIRHIGYGLGSLWGLLTIWKIKTEKGLTSGL